MQRALAEARALEARVDAAVAAIEGGSGRPSLRYERLESQMGPIPAALEVRGDAPSQRPVRLQVDWSLADAIRLLDAGYTVAYVARRTRYDEEIIAALGG